MIVQFSHKTIKTWSFSTIA